MRLRKQIVYSLLIIFFVMLGISAFNIIKWLTDTRNTNKQMDTITNNVDVKEVVDDAQVEIIGGDDVDKFNPYWDYIKMNLIDVDISKLKEENNETIGWIQVSGTNVNYPFVQTKDNSFYLTHTFDKSSNNAGWVFMDYRNNASEFDKNTIIYAHGRTGTTMFGSLKNLLTNNWLDNKDNFVVKLSTEKENTLWQVFSVYHIPTTNDYIQVDFNDSEEFINFGKMLIDRSYYDFNTPVGENDKILTLSTCYSKTDKMVLHAKLIKRSVK